ncbi:MAG: hypothetical protein COC24_004085 [Alphaproteobacteria bacterium]|nr:hypothetical protein [Alphaproteobacteria bacterium]
MKSNSFFDYECDISNISKAYELAGFGTVLMLYTYVVANDLSLIRYSI